MDLSRVFDNFDEEEEENYKKWAFNKFLGNFEVESAVFEDFRGI